MSIYALTILLYIFARFTVNSKNFKLFQVIDWFLIAATLTNSFLGAKAMYNYNMCETVIEIQK